MSERETVVELPWAADCSPCVEKLRTVLPLTVDIRDGVVQLVSILGSVVISRCKGGWDGRKMATVYPGGARGGLTRARDAGRTGATAARVALPSSRRRQQHVGGAACRCRHERHPPPLATARGILRAQRLTDGARALRHLPLATRTGRAGAAVERTIAVHPVADHPACWC
jgi:hypothetical protein